jgi:hypothetical protein
MTADGRSGGRANPQYIRCRFVEKGLSVRGNAQDDGPDPDNDRPRVFAPGNRGTKLELLNSADGALKWFVIFVNEESSEASRPRLSGS